MLLDMPLLPITGKAISLFDISAAEKLPGVVNIFTGKDLVDAKVGGLICGWGVKDKHGDTPVADAKSKGHSSIVALLEEHISSKSRGAAES